MLQEQIRIDKPLHDVWWFIEQQFCIAYGCSSALLGSKEIEFKTLNFLAQPIRVKQRIIETIPNESITLETTSKRDVIHTMYRLESVEEGTLVFLSEDGKGVASNLRSWNYLLMSLPLLRSGSKKKLRRKLESLRNALECEEGDES